MIEERNDALKNSPDSLPVKRYEAANKFLGKGKTVADAACGMGYGTALLKDHDVTGFDNSYEALDYASDNYPGNYAELDIEEMAFGEFDALVCLETLCHLKDPEKFINNLKVSEIVVSAPIDPDPKDGYYFRLHSWSEEKFKKIIEVKYKIKNELWQDSDGQKYLVLHGISNNSNV